MIGHVKYLEDCMRRIELQHLRERQDMLDCLEYLETLANEKPRAMSMPSYGILLCLIKIKNNIVGKKIIIYFLEHHHHHLKRNPSFMDFRTISALPKVPSICLEELYA